MRGFSILVLLAVVCSGCSQSSQKKVVYYYNLDSLLTQQKEQLLAQKASIEKHAFVDNDTAKNTYRPDSLPQWDNELAFFNKMDINKPVLKGIYEMQDVRDTKSNLMIRQFIPKKPKAVEVQYLKVYYLNKLQNVKKIEALYNEDNPIYKSSRQFILEFDNHTGPLLLHTFTVRGGQKMLLKDSVEFLVSGKILQN